MNTKPDDQHDVRPIWGARSIGEAAGLTPRQAFYALESGNIPGRKIGGKWCSTPRMIRRALFGDEE